MSVRHETFNTFWHGGELSPLSMACLSSFLERGHSVKLYCYDAPRVPDGVEIEDARTVLPETELFEFHRSFSAFSNIFRYKLLFERGGWWVDTDVYCLKDDLPDCEYAWANESSEFINGAILKFPAGDASLQTILSGAREVGRNVVIQGQLGPRLLTSHLSGREFPGHFGSTSVFYPVHWLEAYRFWMPNDSGFVAEKTSGSCFVHLWGMMFRYLGIDERISPPVGSFMEQIYRRAPLQYALPPLDQPGMERTTASIRAFLCQEEMRAQSVRLLGYDVSESLPR